MSTGELTGYYPEMTKQEQAIYKLKQKILAEIDDIDSTFDTYMGKELYEMKLDSRLSSLEKQVLMTYFKPTTTQLL